MIINNTAELQAYVPVAEKFNFTIFVPFINKAINSYLIKYVGKLHETLAVEATGENAAIKNEARTHLGAAIANFAYFLFTPYASVQMDSSGMSNIVNENRKNLEWYQLNDIRRELLRSGHESMDLLLEILENNPTLFATWNTDFNTPAEKLIVNTTVDFQKVYNIFNSRQTFLAIRPAIVQVEDQYLKNFVTPALIQELKATVTGNKKIIKEYFQKAIVAFTIAKIYNEGMFHLDANGIKLRFDILPNEAVKAVDYGAQAEQLQRAVKVYIDNGTQYMLYAKELIKANVADFPDGTLINEKSITAVAYQTNGIFSL